MGATWINSVLKSRLLCGIYLFIAETCFSKMSTDVFPSWHYFFFLVSFLASFLLIKWKQRKEKSYVVFVRMHFQKYLLTLIVWLFIYFIFLCFLLNVTENLMCVKQVQHRNVLHPLFWLSVDFLTPSDRADSDRCDSRDVSCSRGMIPALISCPWRPEGAEVSLPGPTLHHPAAHSWCRCFVCFTVNHWPDSLKSVITRSGWCKQKSSASCVKISVKKTADVVRDESFVKWAPFGF